MQTMFQKRRTQPPSPPPPLPRHYFNTSAHGRQYCTTQCSVRNTLQFDKLQEWIAFSSNSSVQESATTAHLSGCHTQKAHGMVPDGRTAPCYMVCAYNNIQKHSIDLCTSTLRHITTQHKQLCSNFFFSSENYTSRAMNGNNGKILALDKPFSGVEKSAWHTREKEETLFPRRTKKSWEELNNSAWHTIHRELIE